MLFQKNPVTKLFGGASLFESAGEAFNLNYLLQQIGTFTRASTATYYDSNGELQSAAVNEARYEYNPADLSFLGLLIEESRTNVCINFNANPTDFTGMTTSPAAGAVISVVDDSTALAAAGLDTVCSSGMVFKIDNSGAAGTSTVQVMGTQTMGVDMTLTCYVRVTAGSAGIRTASATGLVTTTSASYVRLETSVTAPADSRLQMRVEAGNVGYFILNQSEAATAKSSTIVVTGSAATRSADIASLSTADWYSDVEGTFVCEFAQNDLTASSRVFSVNDNSTSDRFIARNLSGSFDFTTVSGGSVQGQLNGDALVKEQFTRFAVAAKENDFALYQDGVQKELDAVALMPVGITTLDIGSDYNNADQLNGHIKVLTYYPERLPNAKLQELSIL